MVEVAAMCRVVREVFSSEVRVEGLPAGNLRDSLVVPGDRVFQAKAE